MYHIKMVTRTGLKMLVQRVEMTGSECIKLIYSVAE
jgi:hypothetical protein